MKLDMSRVRDALTEVEQGINSVTDEVRVSDKPDFVRFYHFRQLIEAGYIDAIDVGHMRGSAYIVEDLTWAGHDLLKKMRNEGVWNRVKAKVSDLGGEVPLRVLEKLLDAGWDALPL